jgi:hypothetical protein
MTLKNGIHTLTRAEYDAIPRMNYSTVKHGLKSLAHLHCAETAKAEGEEEDSTTAQRFGLATHLGVLEPERFKAEVAVWAGAIRRGKAWDEFSERHADKTILTMDEFTRSVAVQEAIRKDTYAARYFDRGAKEMAILWTDMDSGIDCKSMLDVSHEAIVELKTARDASPFAFSAAACRYAYDVQAAMYVDAMRSVSGRELPYILVVAESLPPHLVQVYTVPNWIVEQGRKKYRRILAALKSARLTGLYPGYSLEPMELPWPRWDSVANEDTENAETWGLVIGSKK